LIQRSGTERLQEEHLSNLDVNVERQVALKTFEQSSDLVTCTLTRTDGSEEEIEASWLIGCDGAHSLVRHQLGMSFDGSTMPTEWILADLHLSGMERPLEAHIYWHAEGKLSLFPLGGMRYRVIADVGESTSSVIGEHRVPTLLAISETSRFPQSALITVSTSLSADVGLPLFAPFHEIG